MGHGRSSGPWNCPPFPPNGFFSMGPGGGFGADFGPFHFDFGGPPGRGGGRRRRRGGRMFEGGELQLLLLFLIADKGKARHGYDLIRTIEELTGGEYAPSPGIVYPTLTLLQDMGFIEEAPAEGSRKAYQATDSGRAHIDENAEEVAELFERVTSLGEDSRSSSSTAGPAIGRAVKNLMTALKSRVGRDGLDDDLLHEIAAILDEAAQKVERTK